MSKISVLLVDDQVLFVESLRTVLETRADDFEVVGVAYNGHEAIECVEREKPEVVLMDVRMPEMDGVEATRIIHKQYPKIQVMMLTTFDDDEYVYEALHHGAVGYLLKDIPPHELIASIRAMREGSVQISPTVAAKLVERAYHTEKRIEQKDTQKAYPPWYENLSKREIEVLKLLSKGYVNREISESLFVAEQTIKNHVSLIYSKMKARNRAHAVRMALEAKIDSL